MRVPVVNYLLLLAAALAFAYQLSLGKEVGDFVRAWGFVPATLENALEKGDWEAAALAGRTVLSSMFLHGGWFHILGNLLYLRVFGDNVEDRLGHVPFLLFYLASGAAGAGAQYLAQPGSEIPMVGASGAIAGVLGAYVVLYPTAKIVTLFPIVIFLTFIQVPAVVFLGIWALQQLLNGYLSLGAEVAGGVAWFAHIGGFALGLLVGIVARLARSKRKRR